MKSVNLILLSIVAALVITGTFLVLDVREGKEGASKESATITSPNKLVYSDEQFILGMVPHHQEAIDSSNSILAIADDPEVRTIAQAIVDTQVAEVVQMKDWYIEWFGKSYADDGRYTPMMQSSTDLAVRDAEAQYVKDMIGHHEHAVLMAQDLLSFSRRKELIALSQEVIKTQTGEITQLKNLLANTYGQTPPVIDHSNH